MKKYSFTLSRWHKIVERLNVSISEKSQLLKKRLLNTTFDSSMKTAYNQELVDSYRTAASNLHNEVSILLNDIGKIRTAIGVANVLSEITQMLSKLEVITRASSLTKELYEDLDNQIEYDVFNEMVPTAGYNSNTYKIKIVNDAMIADANKSLIAMKKQSMILSDKISEANAKKIEIELSHISADALSLD